MRLFAKGERLYNYILIQINPNKGFIRQLQEYERFLETQAQAMRRSCDNF